MPSFPGGLGSAGGAGGAPGGAAGAAVLARTGTALPIAGPIPRGCIEPDVEPYTLQLCMGDFNDADRIWNRVIVQVPTLIYPFSNDGLTGTTPLDWIDIKYARNRIQPAQGFASGSTRTQGPGIFPAGARGSCYLWAPGTWWVKCQCGTGVTGVFLGFNAVPCVDPSVLSYWFFSRTPGRSVMTDRTVGTAATEIVRAQDVPDLSAITVQARATSVRLRWEQSGSGTSRYINLDNGDSVTFAGETLPLASLYAHASATTKNLTLVEYF